VGNSAHQLPAKQPTKDNTMAKKAKTKEKRGHLTRLQLVQLHNWLSKRKREARASDLVILGKEAA
jgi:hypothetical protein